LLGDESDDIELVGEKPLNWFDVSAIGTGEMLFSAGWAWIVLIASLYGIQWTIIGFFGGLIVILCAWWLYREMITAVPEPGSIQSYGREARLFSFGTAYFFLYAPVYGGFMWLELQVATGLFHLLLPSVSTQIWPYVVIIPVLGMNLLGRQITGKVQAALVVITLVGDAVIGVVLWFLAARAHVWALNWSSPSPVSWRTFFEASGLWLGIMAGILEVQQVLVDEWKDFARSRDLGLMFGAVQLWVRQFALGFAVMAVFPLAKLVSMPVPTVSTILDKYGHNPLFYAALITMLVATYTTFSVYFMAMGRIVALYAQQGALPRALGRYSSRSVPWVAIVLLGAFAMIGAYWKSFTFVSSVLSTWSATLYFFIALFYILMKRRTTMDRPLVARYGTPIAVFMLLYTGLVAFGVLSLSWKATGVWFLIVLGIVAYDRFIVPRTARGSYYRAQVTRLRTDATRL
jgi:amino acid transporter